MKGAKPKPRIEPTSASRGSVTTPSSTVRAASSAWVDEEALLQLLDVERIGIELRRLQVARGPARGASGRFSG